VVIVHIGKENVWCTTGMTTFSLDKVKLHKDKSEVHRQAEEQELIVSCRTQPGWLLTQQREITKHEQAIQNLMMTCIYLCQQDNSLSSIEPLCILLEKLGVTLLPAEVSGVSYRNSKAAFCFIQHIASYLHEELIEKVKASPVCGMSMLKYLFNRDICFVLLGWMMDESTSRSTEKSCIVYVRYVEDTEAKTSYYGLLDLQGDGTAKNIVRNLTSLWTKDDLNPINSCWLSTDNASTFTGKSHTILLYDH
jgi:hypothetical protein